MGGVKRSSTYGTIDEWFFNKFYENIEIILFYFFSFLSLIIESCNLSGFFCITCLLERTYQYEVYMSADETNKIYIELY